MPSRCNGNWLWELAFSESVFAQKKAEKSQRNNLSFYFGKAAFQNGGCFLK